MTGCSVFGCKNRSEHGYMMKKFPSDLKRRAQWAERVRGNRKNWMPNKSASICEAHFDSSMWEKDRVDGKRALKWNAVPNVFEGEAYKHLKVNSPKRLMPILPKIGGKRVILLPQANALGKSVVLTPEIVNKIMKESNQESLKKVQVDPHHTYCRRFEGPDVQILEVKSITKTDGKSKSIPENAEKYHNYFSKKENIENSSVKDPEDWIVDEMVEPNITIKEIDEEMPENSQPKPKKIVLNPAGEKFILSGMHQIKCRDAGCDRLLFQKERTISLLKKKILTLRREHLKMIKKMNEPTEMLKKIFNEDQIQAMTYKKNTKWSSDTILRSLELVIACGLKGYKELLRQNLPYPSIRTLQRKLDCDVS